MAKAHYLNNKDGKFYPYGHTEAIYDQNGKLLQDVLDGMPKENTTYTFSQDGTTLTITPSNGTAQTIALGTTVYSGTSTPSSSIGNDGDVYYVIATE